MTQLYEIFRYSDILYEIIQSFLNTPEAFNMKLDQWRNFTKYFEIH
jgi:hypothetical protein